MYFKNRVLYDVMHGSDGSDPLRKIHVFARAHTIYDAFDFTGYAINRHTRLFECL